MYKELKNEDIILEEYIDQLKEVAEFHPSSVNTIRVTTVFKDSKVHIMNAAFRMGNNFANIDNHAAGGIVAAIDKETGVVSSSGIDKYSNRYLYHPVTNKQIIGYSIPFWEEIINLAKELATVIPEIGYVGWDIALTESGPLLIEGNYRGMFDVQQQADQIGKRSTYDEIVLGLNK